MKKIKYILVVFVLSLTVLSGCSLPGLGSKSTKMMSKLQHYQQANRKLFHICYGC
ncbi:hypothetical protein UM550_06805 [Staphylococcus aureus]|nr:hypothetical protein UM550_06805 [Staphylococcus aureus]